MFAKSQTFLLSLQRTLKKESAMTNTKKVEVKLVNLRHFNEEPLTWRRQNRSPQGILITRYVKIPLPGNWNILILIR
jgi:hypothetical protein